MSTALCRRGQLHGLRLASGEPEDIEDVSGAQQRRGAEAEQVVRPTRQRGSDLARHSKDLAPLLEREVGRDQRTASLAGLDDDCDRGEPGDDPVARREAPGCRLDARRILGDRNARAADPRSQLGVGGRIVTVDAAAEDRDGCPAGLESPSMRLSVHAAREAADDDESRGRELPAEHSRNLGAVGRAGSCTDDGHRRPPKRLWSGGSAHEEAWRWVVDRREKRRKVSVGTAQPANAGAG